jgi:hypothetical protein
MALLKHGPKWTAAESEQTKRMHEDHVNCLSRGLVGRSKEFDSD